VSVVVPEKEVEGSVSVPPETFIDRYDALAARRRLRANCWSQRGCSHTPQTGSKPGGKPAHDNSLTHVQNRLALLLLRSGWGTGSRKLVEPAQRASEDRLALGEV